MTSANVFNLNSVKQGQVLNANAAKGRSKAENPDAAGVFASLMGSNYSTNFNMPSVDTKINNNVLQQTNAADNYDRYQYQDNTIRQAAGDVVTDVINNSTDTLDQFQSDVVRTVAEQLGVSEDSVKDMMESLGLTAFDLLNPENLAQLAMQLTGETSPMDLLMNDQFQGLMQQMDQLGGQLANELELQPAQMDELIAQMDILQTPETLTDEEMQVLNDAAGLFRQILCRSLRRPMRYSRWINRRMYFRKNQNRMKYAHSSHRHRIQSRRQNSRRIPEMRMQMRRPEIR